MSVALLSQFLEACFPQRDRSVLQTVWLFYNPKAPDSVSCSFFGSMTKSPSDPVLTFLSKAWLEKAVRVLSDRKEDLTNPPGTHWVDPSLFGYLLFFMSLCQNSAVYSSEPHHLKELKARVINTISEVTQQLENVSTDWKIRLNDVSGKLAVRSMAGNTNVSVRSDMYFAFMLYGTMFGV